MIRYCSVFCEDMVHVPNDRKRNECQFRYMVSVVYIAAQVYDNEEICNTQSYQQCSNARAYLLHILTGDT